MLRRLPQSQLFPYTTLFRSPASILDRSSTSLINANRCLPAAWIFCRSRTFDIFPVSCKKSRRPANTYRSEEHTSELQSQSNLVCRLLLEKKNVIRGQPRVRD